ncbi:MAG: SpoIVB peptidase [Bacillota bacterium]|jgi:stage IV sporulation protein B
MAIKRWIGTKKPRSIQYRQIIGLILITVLVFGASTQFIGFFFFPPQVKVSVGEPLQIPLFLPQVLTDFFSLKIKSVDGTKGVLILEGNEVKQGFDLRGLPVAECPGTVDLELRLFGFIPLKKMVVTVASPVKVVPGGHSIGVFLRQGVQIIDLAPIRDETGQEHCPGKNAGLQTGDVLLSVNNVAIMDELDLARAVNQAGQEGKAVKLLIERGSEQSELAIEPIFCLDTKRYRIGLLVKDGSAGVGTLTFYNPESRVYGALGHVIVDARSNQEIKIKNGRVVSASVRGIQPGRKGQPGEKIGVIESESLYGTIDKNSKFGIFGILSKDIANSLYPEPIPVAWQNQVHKGQAEMLTVINGKEIESFTVEVEKILTNQSNGKGMVIRVVDPRLLELTGGIIQGMSGSPLIQDGRLIGAVTHVFVNDPARGYALLAEYMLTETLQIPQKISSVRNFYLTDFFFI